MPLRIRPVEPRDAEVWSAMRCALFPGASSSDLRGEVAERLAGKPCSTLPIATLLAEEDGRPVGFVEVSLRSHVDGCDTSRLAGYLEEWWVDPAARRRGVGSALVRAAEDWARAQGCREIGSDTLTGNDVSERAHAALGYEVVDRCVNFRKTL